MEHKYLPETSLLSVEFQHLGAFNQEIKDHYSCCMNAQGLELIITIELDEPGFFLCNGEGLMVTRCGMGAGGGMTMLRNVDSTAACVAVSWTTHAASPF